MLVTSGGELCVGATVGFCRLDVVDQINEGVESRVSQREESVLYVFDASL